MHDQDLFFQCPRHSHKTAEGQVELPILYYDSTFVLSFFRADAAAVRDLLPEGLELALTWSGFTAVAMALYEYRDTSVGAYNEVGLAVPVYSRGDFGAPVQRLRDLFRKSDVRAQGYYIIDLPVTTPQANDAGRSLWGYPKFVTPIPFTLSAKHLSCSVQDPAGGPPIVTIGGNTQPLLPLPVPDLVLYSQREGQWLRTLVNTRGGLRLHRSRQVRLYIGNSQHPMAAHLRRMGLDGARPMALLSSEQFQSRLNEGVPFNIAGSS